MQELIQLIDRYRAAVTAKAREETLGAIWGFLNPPIFLFFLGRVSKEDAQDLRSETLTEIHKGLSKFRGESSAAAWSWCYTIAKRRLAQHFEEKDSSIIEARDPEHLANLVGASDESKPFESAKEKMDVYDALEILRKSDPDCYVVLWNRFIVGMAFEELAAKAEKSYDAVRMQVSRCIDKLEPLLE